MRSYLYRIVAVAFLLTLTVSTVMGGYSAHIGGLSWSPDGQSLLCSVAQLGVFVVKLDGTAPQRVGDPAYYESSPQWSPDGQTILTTLELDNQLGIYRIPSAGGEPERLTEDAGWRDAFFTTTNGIQPIYSPDGQSIAFIAQRESDQDFFLYRMTADGEDERRLTQIGSGYYFSWSPDGKFIVFAGFTKANYADLFLVDSEGLNMTPLTTTGDLDFTYRPVWTPDGKHILFTIRTGDSNGRIDSIDADGQNRQVFLEHGSGPIFSPDGTHILFFSPNGYDANLSIMSADNTEADPIVISQPEQHDYYSAAWSPDSSRIAFVSFLYDADINESIVLVNADGSDRHTVVELPTA